MRKHIVPTPAQTRNFTTPGRAGFTRDFIPIPLLRRAGGKRKTAGVKLRVIADDVSVMVLGTSAEHR